MVVIIARSQRDVNTRPGVSPPGGDLAMVFLKSIGKAKNIHPPTPLPAEGSEEGRLRVFSLPNGGENTLKTLFPLPDERGRARGGVVR
jgi:hypothetical protein